MSLLICLFDNSATEKYISSISFLITYLKQSSNKKSSSLVSNWVLNTYPKSNRVLKVFINCLAFSFLPITITFLVFPLNTALYLFNKKKVKSLTTNINKNEKST